MPDLTNTPETSPASAAEVAPVTFAGFDAFFDAHNDEVTKALAFGLGDQDLGAEAAAEAFIRACQRWDSVSRMDRPAGWVYRVGLNWGRSVLRRRRRDKAKRALLARSDEVTEAWPDVDLAAALQTLSDEHRDVVVARFYLDMSVEQTAEALEIAPGTVKSRLSRALTHLERLLADSHAGRSRAAGDHR